MFLQILSDNTLKDSQILSTSMETHFWDEKYRSESNGLQNDFLLNEKLIFFLIIDSFVNKKYKKEVLKTNNEKK